MTAYSVPNGAMNIQQSTLTASETLRARQRKPSVLPYAASALFVAAVALFGTVSSNWLPATGLPLLFLAAVLSSAATFGFWPGIVAALIAFATYNFLFVEPLYSLQVTHAADVLALALFLFTAGLTGWLAGRARDEADAANRRAAHLSVLSRYTAMLSNCSKAPQVFDALTSHVASIAHEDVVVMQSDEGRMTPIASTVKDIQLDDFSLQACERAFRYGSGQPATAHGWQGSRFGFYPLVVDGMVAAVAGVRFPRVRTY